MNEESIHAISQVLQLGFMVSLVLAAFVLRRTMRKRHVDRVRKQEERLALENDSSEQAD